MGSIPQEVDLAIPCTLSYQLLKDMNNIGNTNSGTTMTWTQKVKVTRSFKRTDFVKTVKERTQDDSVKKNLSAEAGVSYGPVSAKISASLDVSKEVKDFVSTAREVTTETNETSEEETIADYKVGAGDRLMIYQQIFNWPGQSYNLDVIVTSKEPLTEIKKFDISVRVKPLEYLKDLKVVYGDQPYESPPDLVKEWSDMSTDLNNKNKGDYVWLVPVRTYNRNEAATRIEFFSSDEKVSGMDDLAKGAGGKYRYLRVIRNDRDPKIGEVILWRASWGAITSSNRAECIGAAAAKKWVGSTGDINDGRGGDYLHLLWTIQD